MRREPEIMSGSMTTTMLSLLDSEDIFANFGTIFLRDGF